MGWVFGYGRLKRVGCSEEREVKLHIYVTSEYYHQEYQLHGTARLVGIAMFHDGKHGGV